jgi:hypothetical protein
VIARQGTLAAVAAISVAPSVASRNKSLISMDAVEKRMVEDPFAQFSLEQAIGLRWTLRDIQARRLKMSPVSGDDLRTLTGLGLVELRGEGLVLTPAGTAVLNGS